MNRDSLRPTLLTLALLAPWTAPAAASVSTTTDYRQLAGASFGDVDSTDGSGLGRAFLVGGVGVTTSSQGARGFVYSGTMADPAAPVGNYAFSTTVGSLGTPGPLFLNFDQAVSGVGVTFRNSVSPGSAVFAGPIGRIDLFDGPYGTGNLLGTAIDPAPSAGGPLNLYDFVGLSTGALNVRSAVITGVGPDQSYTAVGFAVSRGVDAVGVPEPAAVAAFLALLPLAVVARRRSNRIVSHGGDITHG